MNIPQDIIDNARDIANGNYFSGWGDKLMRIIQVRERIALYEEELATLEKHNRDIAIRQREAAEWLAANGIPLTEQK